MILYFKKFNYIFSVFLSFLILKTDIVFAKVDYVPLVSDGPLNNAAKSANLSEFLITIYNFGVGIAVALSVLFIIFGGIQYMTTDAMFKKEEGRKRITAAVAGLLIALSSWIILNQINPKIFQNDLTLKPIQGGGGSNIPLPDGGTPGGGTNYQGVDLSPNGEPFNPRLTAYSPQKAGALIGMEGGYASSRPGLDGISIVRTLDDYVAGRSSYVTLAGDSSQYGKNYIIPSITYINSIGQSVTLNNVPGYVHDTGSAFVGAGNSKFDIPIGRDYGNSLMNKQPFNGSNTQFIPATNK